MQALHFNKAMGFSQASTARLNFGIHWMSSLQRILIFQVLAILVILGISLDPFQLLVASALLLLAPSLHTPLRDFEIQS